MLRENSRALGAAIVLAATLAGTAQATDLYDMLSPPLPEGDVYAVDWQNRLRRLQSNNLNLVHSTKPITGLAAGELVRGGDFRPADNRLYVLTSFARIYTIALDTAAATLKTTLKPDPADTTSPYAGLSGTDFGVDFNPTVDRLRVVSNTGQNLRVNVDSGFTTTDAALNPGMPMATAAAYTVSQADACRTTLFVIDAQTDALFVQNPPNDGVLVPIGGLGLGDVQRVSGFDVQGAGRALAALTVSDEVKLYSINLNTGKATLAGQPGITVFGRRLNALALPIKAETQPLGELVGLTELNKIVSFNRNLPGRLCSSKPLSGVIAGESLVGIDTRASNGKLYGVGSGGNVYTVNATTGAASVMVTMFPDPADPTDPFGALSGFGFGLDFNPVVDRLRIVSSSRQNLRVNVDTGATLTDAALNPGTPLVTAAAYSNNDNDPATATTLYDIDVGSDALFIQTPPNNGTLVAVGAGLGIGDIGGMNGFEIFGAANSALAALTLGAESFSRLYAVNLTAGTAAATATNNVIGGGERLKGLAATQVP